ncbi:hypothetical protein [Microbacterium sp. BLY]|uniref:hypothetical protein n=1 Tax=Microbacterium sp. BLY TaxID=2823280 RepID=UPI001B324B18|nr:hypothetical protein [Microbacterium sp. BLY]MBP3976840.1 hypothetical protein [Microbacterium sp. BLY]
MTGRIGPRAAVWALILSWGAGSAVQLGVLVHGVPFDLASTLGMMGVYQIFSIPLAVWSVAAPLLAMVASGRWGRTGVTVAIGFLAALVGGGISTAIIVQLTLSSSDTTTFSTLPETVVALGAFHFIAWGVLAAVQSGAARSRRTTQARGTRLT